MWKRVIGGLVYVPQANTHSAGSMLSSLLSLQALELINCTTTDTQTGSKLIFQCPQAMGCGSYTPAQLDQCKTQQCDLVKSFINSSNGLASVSICVQFDSLELCMAGCSAQTCAADWSQDHEIKAFQITGSQTVTTSISSSIYLCGQSREKVPAIKKATQWSWCNSSAKITDSQLLKVSMQCPDIASCAYVDYRELAKSQPISPLNWLVYKFASQQLGGIAVSKYPSVATCAQGTSQAECQLLCKTACQQYTTSQYVQYLFYGQDQNTATLQSSAALGDWLCPSGYTKGELNNELKTPMASWVVCLVIVIVFVVVGGLVGFVLYWFICKKSPVKGGKQEPMRRRFDGPVAVKNVSRY